MKHYSNYSLGFIVIGLLLFGINWIIEGYVEPIVLIGVICLLVGILFSYIAIVKKEVGRLKFVSLISFFIILLIISWIEPFQILRIMTWLKNIS